jgi:hypothetical protein
MYMKMSQKPILKLLIINILAAMLLPSCLPPSDPYPHRPPAEVVAEAEAWSGGFEAYIKQWAQGQASSAVPATLIPDGITDSKNFYLKNPDQATPAETWAVRYAKPIDKNALLAGIPDPKVTYLFLGTALAPFGSKLVMEGEFPHCRFFSVQVTAPLDGKEYYAQRQFGAAEVSIIDADMEPLPGHTNPFRVGADRNATQRKYRLTFDLTTGDPTALNNGAHQYPYRANDNNNRAAAMLTYQGPLGKKTVIGTPIQNGGDWNLGALWVRIYEPDDAVDALGGVPMPKVWFELPDGTRYFVGSDFSTLQQRADTTIANRTVAPSGDNTGNDTAPHVGWFKSWNITRSMLNGVCLANNWSRPDSGARVRDIDLGWTGRGEFQPGSGSIEPHATTNNYASYLGRSLSVPPGYVAVLTGKLPTFPATRNSEATMTTGQVRYWSICGIDQDPLSPLPATTIHAISDDDVVIDDQRNYVIAYSRPEDRPDNAQANNGVSWVDWGTQSSHGLLMRWVCVDDQWSFPLSPHENHLSWARSDWSGSQYDSTLIGTNWRNGFLQCYLPRVHLLTVAEFEALGNALNAERVPVWVTESFKTGVSEAQLGTVSASSLLDNTPANAAENAIDGNVNTAWSSAFGQSTATITADLGSAKTISAIKLHWDWVLFAKNYTIETSNDNATWTTLIQADNQNGQIDLYKNLMDVTARYVRLQLAAPNVFYYRLAEFEVFTSDCDCEAGGPSSVHAPAGNHKMDFSIVPNPVTDLLRIQLDTDGQKTGSIEIFDLNGRLQWKWAGQVDQPFYVGHLPAGSYWCRWSDGKGRLGGRWFVKM